MRPTIVVSAASFWAAVAPPSGVQRPSSKTSSRGWPRSSSPRSSATTFIEFIQSVPSDASAPDMTPQPAMTTGSPGGMVTTPSGSSGACADTGPTTARASRPAAPRTPKCLPGHRSWFSSFDALPRQDGRGQSGATQRGRSVAASLARPVRPHGRHGRTSSQHSPSTNEPTCVAAQALRHDSPAAADARKVANQASRRPSWQPCRARAPAPLTLGC